MSARPATSIDVQQFIDLQPLSARQWLIFAMCFAVVLLDGFDTSAIGFIAPSLLGEWGVARTALSPVLSAALFGLACGALLAGPLADRLGRRALLSVSVALFGIACLISSQAGNLTELTVSRFVTGLGLGAAMPTAATLMNEYCPKQRRATLVNLMFCGFPLGAALGGFLAAWMIPHFGWRSVLVFGGVTPLLLLIVLLLAMPESIRYQVASRHAGASILRTLSRVWPYAAADLRPDTVFTLTEQSAVSKQSEAGALSSGERRGLRLVLSRDYLLGTLMLWTAYFMGLVIFYASINWMPILLREGGVSPAHAALISALFPLGGVGAVLCGYLMDRFNADRIIALCYALTAVSMAAVGQALGHVGLLILAVFCAGVLMNTAQSSLPALAAAYYPTQGRGTGVSWMLGIGRFGGIAGSFLVAELGRRHFTFGGIFATVALAGVVACLALLIKYRGRSGAPNDPLNRVTVNG
ncbi:MFS transporter [Robbsia sp. KACC 23696]|uniref:MFS transporter n=1 Tax=Robbsia sp. KACC 23696 TaxID=3149231 RepID=UPI00325BCA5A